MWFFKFKSMPKLNTMSVPLSTGQWLLCDLDLFAIINFYDIIMILHHCYMPPHLRGTFDATTTMLDTMMTYSDNCIISVHPPWPCRHGVMAPRLAVNDWWANIAARVYRSTSQHSQGSSDLHHQILSSSRGGRAIRPFGALWSSSGLSSSTHGQGYRHLNPNRLFPQLERQTDYLSILSIDLAIGYRDKIFKMKNMSIYFLYVVGQCTFS